MTAELVCAATDRDAWLAARRSGVTATDIVTILGLNPWGSEYALYWEKLGKLPEFEGSPRTRLGQELESYIAAEWTEAHGYPTQAAGLWRSQDRSWQLATPDRIVFREFPDPGTAEISLLEVKTWDDHDRAAWEGTVPPRVRAQVLWQMDTLGVGVGHVGVLFLPSGEFESRVIEHAGHDHGGIPLKPAGDGKHLEHACPACADVAYMRQVGEAFWGRVREGLPPFPDGSPVTLAAVKALHAGVCAGTAEVDPEVWNAWVGARSEVKRWEELAREYEATLRLGLGDAEVGTVGGEPVVKRSRFSVAEKTIVRKAYEVDRLARLGARNGDSDGTAADND